MENSPARVNPFFAALGAVALLAGLIVVFAKDTLNLSGFEPHGYCFFWQSDLLWIFVTSDSLIALAYMTIAASLAYLVWRVRRDLPFHWMFLAFGTFIFACGLTHLWGIVTLWQPWYHVDAALKAVTAVASIITAVVAPPMIPRVQHMLSDARTSAANRLERDHLLEQQLAAVATLQASLASREDDLGRLANQVAAQRREREVLLEQLRQSEARYRQIVETAREGIWLVDARGLTTYVNTPMADMLGYSVDELVGQNVEIAIPHEERAHVRARLTRRNSGLSDQYDVRLRTKQGDDRWVLVSSNPLYDDQGQFAGSLAMVTDITERRRLEAQMLQTQKLESIGQLAGGVAHDFNNLLVIIRGGADLAADSLPADHPALTDIDAIREAADRAAALTKQLLAFARRQPGDMQSLQVNDLIASIRPLLSRLLPEHIDLQIYLDNDLGSVWADTVQIEQVIINLVVNARDAMLAGGRLVITTDMVVLNERDRPHPSLAAGSYVRVTVADTGVGMSDDVQRHAFEPFFTTKGPANGTGLGLATCYGIVSQHNGALVVSSTVGVGTSIDVYLSSRTQDAGPTVTTIRPLHQFTGTETILLVEDALAVRALTARVLRGLGYTVLEAANGQEALGIVEKHSGPPIALLLTDVVMPHMGGLSLADQLAPRFPAMKIMLMSGYADLAFAAHGALDSTLKLLSKPFTPDALARVVRGTLDSQPTGAR